MNVVALVASNRSRRALNGEMLFVINPPAARPIRAVCIQLQNARCFVQRAGRLRSWQKWAFTARGGDGRKVHSSRLDRPAPSAIYTVNALMRSAKHPFMLTIFEKQKVTGRGAPYRPSWNDPAMLSNIASIEIPPLEQLLVDRLRPQP